MTAVYFFQINDNLIIYQITFGFSKYSAEIRCGTVCAAAASEWLTDYIRRINYGPAARHLTRAFVWLTAVTRPC